MKKILGSTLVLGAAVVLAVGLSGAGNSAKVKSNSADWAEDYPEEFNTWKKTAGSDEIIDLLEKKPQLIILWAGYGFAKDYNAPRGHFYALQSNRNTLRTGAPTDANSGPMPTACWTCKSSDVPRVMQEVGELEFFTGKWAKYGPEIANSIGCADCHDSESADLTISRPYLERALQETGFDLSKATEDDMRSLVCAQCHSEYYFKPTEWTDAEGNKKTAKVVTFPWRNGMSAEAMEKYYDALNFKDWTHKISRAPMLKAQHPGYEMFMTGIHGQSGVSCADCHMPTVTVDGSTFTDHNIRANPLDDMENTCLRCHESDKDLLKAVVARKLERKEELMEITMNNLAKAHLEAGKAWELGATEAEMAGILLDIRHGQWRWDYAIASHGSFFHAPEETLRILGVANDKAQSARIKLAKVLAKYGAAGYVAPDFSTKEKAQKLAGVPFRKLVDEKKAFRKGLLKEWEKAALKKGLFDPKLLEGMSDHTSYD